MIKLKFIGSGCWQGIPSPFCDDEISKNVKWNTKDFRFRTSLYIETENSKKILIEITPDIRLQSWKFNLRVPDMIFVSHWHFDHFFGLLDLEWQMEKNKVKIYSNKITKNWYNKSFKHIPIDFKVISTKDSIVIDNLKIIPFKVKHVNETFGFIFENIKTNKKFTYLPDFYDIPKNSLSLINRTDIISVDSTYLEKGIEDSTHLESKEIINFIESKIKVKKIILMNINSFCEKNHKELIKKYKKYEISYDGMEILI